MRGRPSPSTRVLAERAMVLRATHDAQVQRTADLTRQAVAALRADGVTYRDIGELLGISYQRAAQISRTL